MDHAVSQMPQAMRRRAIRTILAVGADCRRLGDLAGQLGKLNHRVVLADSPVQALDLIAARGIDLVLVDTLPDGAALYLVRQVASARESSDLPIALVADSEAALTEALQAGADDGVAQPYAMATLAARIERLLARAARVEELKRTNLALDARIAARAIELGEARDALAALQARRPA